MDDAIARKMFENRARMTDVDESAEEERRCRMLRMLQSSRKYKRIAVEQANNKWFKDQTLSQDDVDRLSPANNPLTDFPDRESRSINRTSPDYSKFMGDPYDSSSHSAIFQSSIRSSTPNSRDDSSSSSESSTKTSTSKFTRSSLRKNSVDATQKRVAFSSSPDLLIEINQYDLEDAEMVTNVMESNVETLRFIELEDFE
ncbi:hypothetical protein BDR26DRAFT_231405 [Obelidium mucronatum]|nr:hypothetical protein BDR26DRAFT_231405 [Obelidium mucronatum]